MRKISILSLSVGIAIGFASCGSGESNTSVETAQIAVANTSVAEKSPEVGSALTNSLPQNPVSGSAVFTGTIRNHKGGTVRLAELGNNVNQKVIGTSQVDANGNFSIAMQVNSINEQRLVNLVLSDQMLLYVVLKPGNFNVDLDMNDPSSINIQGDKASIEATTFISELSRKAQSINSIKAQEGPLRAQRNQAALEANQKKFESAIQEYYSYVKGTYGTLQSPVVKLYALNMLNVQTDAKFIQSSLKSIPSTYSAHQYYSALNTNLLQAKQWIGEKAPEIVLANTQGVPTKLSDMKGKVVLLDFWASWCGPCRRENPNVVKAYDKYKEKGFTVFSVSLDRKKDPWLAAIQADNLKWDNHVSELKGWGSQAIKPYGVNSIPATFLLDKDGVIVAKNLRGNALEQKLAELLD